MPKTTVFNRLHFFQSAHHFAHFLSFLVFLPQAHDKNLDKVLDKLEFEAMLSSLGVFLSTQELRTLYNHFDHDKNGVVSYDEFMQAMRVRTISKIF